MAWWSSQRPLWSVALCFVRLARRRRMKFRSGLTVSFSLRVAFSAKMQVVQKSGQAPLERTTTGWGERERARYVRCRWRECECFMSGIAGKYLNLAARRRQFSSSTSSRTSLSARQLYGQAIMIFSLNSPHTHSHLSPRN